MQQPQVSPQTSTSFTGNVYVADVGLQSCMEFLLRQPQSVKFVRSYWTNASKEYLDTLLHQACSSAFCHCKSGEHRAIDGHQDAELVARYATLPAMAAGTHHLGFGGRGAFESAYRCNYARTAAEYQDALLRNKHAPQTDLLKVRQLSTPRQLVQAQAPSWCRNSILHSLNGSARLDAERPPNFAPAFTHSPDPASLAIAISMSLKMWVSSCSCRVAGGQRGQGAARPRPPRRCARARRRAAQCNCLLAALRRQQARRERRPVERYEGERPEGDDVAAGHVASRGGQAGGVGGAGACTSHWWHQCKAGRAVQAP